MDSHGKAQQYFRGASSSRKLAAAGLTAGVLVVAMVELPMVKTQQRILAVISEPSASTSKAEAMELLRRPGRVELLHRLAFPPQQFSSASAIFPCGIIDVFGPLTHVVQGWPTPDERARSPLRGQNKMRQLFAAVSGLKVDELSAPTSWRGLSTHERRQFERERLGE